MTSPTEARHSQADPDRWRENGKASRIGWGVDMTLEEMDVRGRCQVSPQRTGGRGRASGHGGPG